MENVHERFLNLNLSDDWLFKEVMSDGSVLKSFLVKLLGENKVGELVDINTSYEIGSFRKHPKIVCDILARDDLGRVFIIENQNYYMRYLLNRMDYYASLACIKANNWERFPNKDGSYKKYPEVYCIWICAKVPFKSKKARLTFTLREVNENISWQNKRKQIVLNRKYLENEEDDDLRSFLKFFGKSSQENAIHSSWDMVHLLYKRINEIK